jgi:hypothetical protein
MEKTKDLIYDVVTDIRYGTVTSKTINKLKRFYNNRMLRKKQKSKEAKKNLIVFFENERRQINKEYLKLNLEQLELDEKLRQQITKLLSE